MIWADFLHRSADPEASDWNRYLKLKGMMSVRDLEKYESEVVVIFRDLVLGSREIRRFLSDDGKLTLFTLM